ncbi:MAG: hypothetical protein QG656_2247, partial [Candidatus Hydrogenedentes bacterium]|nr:hypothetical protein [Candidatus Hydrogenedentota bacterium]
RDVVVVNQPNFSWGNAQISSGPPSRRSQPNKPAVNPAAPKAPQPAEGAAPESPENTAGEPAADAESADTDAEAADAEGTEEASEESADAEDTAAKEDEGKDDTSAKDGESSDSAEAKPKKKTEKELVAEAKAAAKKDADIQVIKAMRSQNAWFYGPDGKEMTNEELDKRLETGDVAGLSAVGTIYQDRWTANSSYDPEPESESEKEAPKKR